MNNLAISYARFSSLIQSEGDSLRRQSEEAEAYAAANGLVLDHSRSFRDLGVSAYDSSNINKGALGLFLTAVMEGKIPVGTTLIIESFDRLSRATPLDALGIFTQIINSGLNLVVLTAPPKLFSRESVQANMFQLFEALMDMHRAHQESERKSQLVSAAWNTKKTKAKDGLLMSLRAPNWITVTMDTSHDRSSMSRRTAVLDPERAATVLKIVELAEKDVGNFSIVKILHSEKIPAFSASKKWVQSYIQKILSNPALYGAILLDGELIENYYPPLITKERFIYLQSLRGERATRRSENRKGKNVTNLFSGKLKCGYCGSSCNVGGYKRKDTGYERKYVGCQGARDGAKDCKWRMWFLDDLEDTLLFWITNLDYSKFFNGNQKTSLDDERIRLASLKNDTDVARGRVENLMVAIEDGGSGLVQRLAQRETELAVAMRLLEAQRQKVSALALHEGGSASRMQGMVLLFKALKNTTDEIQLRSLREQLSSGIHRTVDKIQLFPSGRRLDGEKADRFIDITFVNGEQRRIEPQEC